MPWIVTAYERPERIVFEYGRPFPATAEFSFRADQVALWSRVTPS